MLTSRRKRFLTIVVTATAIVALAYLLIPREKLLMDSARRVPGYDSTTDRYWMWLSEHEAIVSSAKWDGSSPLLYRVNTDTGVRTPIDALNRKYQDIWSPPFSGSRIYPLGGRLPDSVIFRLSPDGKWLLFNPTSYTFTKPVNCPCIAVRLDGTGEIRWRSTGNFPTGMRWTSDSRRWLETIQPSIKSTKPDPVERFTLRDVSNPTLEQRVTSAVPDSRKVVQIPYVIPFVLPDDRICVVSSTDETLGGLPLVRVTVSSLDNAALSSTHDILMPRHGEMDTAALSRDGKRMAWLVRYRTRGVLDWLKDNLHWQLTTKSDYYGVWLSNLDGSNMTEVGHVRYIDYKRPGIMELQWLPGGKKISFVRDSGLFVVPVE